MDNRASLILVPGLGVDGRIYAPQTGLPLPMQIVEWIEPESCRETLAHYATRMSSLMRIHGNSYVGGISLGAMVAIEAARHIGVRGVISIGGCSSPREISPLFRVALKIGALLPASGVRRSLALAPCALRLAEELKPAHIELMTRMLREHSPEQIRWSCRAILEWDNEGSSNDAPQFGIHGGRDEVIPLRNAVAQCVVPEGRHLINLSHPMLVNQFILDCTTPV